MHGEQVTGARYLAHGNSTFSRELLLGLLARVRITEVRVEVLVQNFGRLFTEVPSLAPATRALFVVA